MKKIGIIGGAGPEASALLYSKIIQYCQQQYGCKNDSDFPEIVVLSYPFSAMLSDQDAHANLCAIESELQYCFDQLNTYGIDVAVIACNTLHTFLKNIQMGNVKLVHLAQTATAAAVQKQIKNLLILGTEQTVKTGLYASDALICTTPTPGDQVVVSAIIDTILAGKVEHADADRLIDLINEARKRFLSKGQTPIDGVLLGCTELSVLVQRFPARFSDRLSQEITVIDPIESVTQKLMEECLSRSIKN